MFFSYNLIERIISMSFEDITPETFQETGAEEPELAEPVAETNETGAEDQGLAEPESEASETEPVEEEHHKNTPDESFAEMRRAMQEAQQEAEDAKAELAEFKAKAEAREAAMEEMDIDDIDAIAEQAGITREEVLATIEREEAAAAAELEAREKDQRIEQLEEELQGVYAEKAMEEDLVALQKLDPSLKSLDDLGKDYGDYIAAGLSAEQAYYAIKGRDIATKSVPPTAPGKIADTSAPEKDYFTEEEVAAMTSEEKTLNAEKIMASLPRWKKP